MEEADSRDIVVAHEGEILEGAETGMAVKMVEEEADEEAAAEEAKVEETKVEVTTAEEKKETNVAEDLERQEHQVTSRVREGESKGSMTVRAARVKQKAVQAAQAAVAAEAALQAAVTELASSVVAATAVAATAAEA